MGYNRSEVVPIIVRYLPLMWTIGLVWVWMRRKHMLHWHQPQPSRMSIGWPKGITMSCCKIYSFFIPCFFIHLSSLLTFFLYRPNSWRRRRNFCKVYRKEFKNEIIISWFEWRQDWRRDEGRPHHYTRNSLLLRTMFLRK